MKSIVLYKINISAKKIILIRITFIEIYEIYEFNVYIV